MKKELAFYFIAGFSLLFLLLLSGGCLSPQEQRGYTSLPQNRPASWEDRPYGELRM